MGSAISLGGDLCHLSPGLLQRLRWSSRLAELEPSSKTFVDQCSASCQPQAFLGPVGEKHKVQQCFGHVWTMG